MSAFTALKLHADTPADSLSASEYESGFRAGEREQHTERRAGEFFGGGRYALLARARAFFYRGVFYTPSVNVTRSQQRSQQLRNLRVKSSRESVSMGLCLLRINKQVEN